MLFQNLLDLVDIDGTPQIRFSAGVPCHLEPFILKGGGLTLARLQLCEYEAARPCQNQIRKPGAVTLHGGCPSAAACHPSSRMESHVTIPLCKPNEMTKELRFRYFRIQAMIARWRAGKSTAGAVSCRWSRWAHTGSV